MKFSENSWIKNIEAVIHTFASIAIIVGIIFAYIQIKQTTDLEKKRTATEAIRLTTSNEFLKAYARLKGRIKLLVSVIPSSNNEDQTLIDDCNYVMNILDYIAILYTNDVADRCIIKNAIYAASKDISDMFDKIKINGKPYPQKNRRNFDTLILLMDKELCGQNDKTKGLL